MPTLTPALRAEYVQLFNTCQIKPTRHDAVDDIVNRLLASKDIYVKAQTTTGVPWYFIGLVHSLESNFSFKKHLHNGDPLSARTVNVPAGRPKKGTPPFTWEQSMVDALELQRLSGSSDWSLSGILFRLEGYNGYGYRTVKPPINSPYLWSFSNHYTKGKYVADNVYSPTAVSAQCGAAVILRRLAELGHVKFPDQSLPGNGKPLVVNWQKNQPTDAAFITLAKALQRWLNTFKGIFVREDGWPGNKTSDAYKIVTGKYLPGDPRG